MKCCLRCYVAMIAAGSLRKRYNDENRTPSGTNRPGSTTLFIFATRLKRTFSLNLRSTHLCRLAAVVIFGGPRGVPTPPLAVVR